MNQDLFEWLLLLGRWLHITVAVTWIGTSIFFMWLDRTLVKNLESKKEGHVGELWMVHGGGFYHVEKLLMGPTKVPEVLHWFKWESYWTWLSGVFLIVMIFYTGNGIYLLDQSVSNITYLHAVLLGIFSIIGSWFLYDFLWERKISQNKPIIGHILTILWFIFITYYLCHKLSGRAAYMHIGAMIGTWMTANVFMRIIPRQIQMVNASKKGMPVNKEWAINAKNRSTHNTYFTLPIIFIMLSNHFPSTYGDQYNWIILLGFTATGASIREYFVKRKENPYRSKIFLSLATILLLSIISFSRYENLPADNIDTQTQNLQQVKVLNQIQRVKNKNEVSNEVIIEDSSTYNVSGTIHFKGKDPLGKKLRLPKTCAKQYSKDVYYNEVNVKNGKLKNVLVRIIKGINPKQKFNTPTNEIRIEQKGCLYRPQVSAAMVGQSVRFVNEDRLFHNIKSVPKNNSRFNFALPRLNQSKIKVFMNKELFIHAQCSLHPWMSGYISILDNPYFSLSNSDGKYILKGLKKGNYTIEFLHHTLGKKFLEITIKDQSINVDQTFSSKESIK